MKKRLSLIFLIPFMFGIAKSEPVVIEGKAPAYKGAEAELVTVKDHLTKMDSVLDKTRVSSQDGKFRFEVTSSRIRPAWVRIAHAKAKIYLEPGAAYRVKFPALPEGHIKRAYGYTKLKMTFYELPKHDANNLVIDLNKTYDRFFAKNYQSLSLRFTSGGGFRRNRTDISAQRDSITKAKIRQAPTMEHLVDSLENALNERYSKVDKEWFRVHYRHVLASLQETASKDRDAIYRRYFKKETVRFHHEEYMAHFLDFYDEYLIDLTKREDSLLDLKAVLNHQKDPAPILQALRSKEAEYMGRSAIRELVVVDGMFDAFYHRKDYDKAGIHAVLDSLASGSEHAGIRTIAENLSEFLEKRQRGARAPSFHLMDADTNIVSLKDLRGEPVYLNFWATWSETSRKHMQMIEKLHKSYGDNVQFVSISMDDKLRDMKAFLRKHPEYDWTFLFMGEHEAVKKAYEVASIPAYHLLNEKGRFVRVPAPKPGENARKVIHRLDRRIERKKKRREKGMRDH
ncbi:MAG: TlpA family protein disulfide reductase [Flavobacteriales bacterium]